MPAPLRSKRARVIARLLTLARYRARKAGVMFTLKAEDITIPARCPVLGRRLRFDGPSRDRPSIDRIVPGLGYVPGNVIVVSHRANWLKGDGSVHELRDIYKFYARLHRRKGRTQ